MNYSPGHLALLGGVLVVTGFAIAGLVGWIAPVVGAAVGLGAQVVGTIAFFAAYLIGNKDLEARSAPPARPHANPGEQSPTAGRS